MENLDAEIGLSALHEWLASIESRFSIEIDQCRQIAFEHALTGYAESLGETLETLATRAKRGLLDSEHWSMILHLATNHETRFFRSPAALKQIGQICQNLSHPKVLSVGCSTGEEPYSIAAALYAAGHDTFEILGTDISAVCIKTAKLGIYKQHPNISSLLAGLLPEQRMRFHPWVKGMVKFEQHNILQDRPVQLLKPNVVITQNMLIYYREETRYEILNRLASMLGVGGYLITAPAETLGWKTPAMTRVHHSQINVFVRSS
ncbi:CheR family methyltransferase [Pseudomonas sp. NPDC089569]|uniref:CheR family methyltransferase n=1 Tax=Pseudomonas sp. NPDC089569 TaxID=3390722 RepID=UPI003CFD7B80